MPKLKTHKGVKRRVKVTGTGKLMAYPTGRRHLLTGKSSRTQRPLRRQVEIDATNIVKLKRLIPYS